jgi:archaellum component FlaC
MLKRIASFHIVFILFLFGFTLITVSPVFAADGDGFTVCDNMPEAASKLSCFRDLARSLRAAVEDMTTAASSQEAAVDKAEGNKRATDAFIETQAENEEYLKSELKRMKAELEAANSALAKAEAAVETLTAEKGDLTTAVETLTAEKGDLTTAVETLTAEKGDLTTAVETLTAEKVGLQASVDKAEAEIADLQSQLTAAQSESQANEGSDDGRMSLGDPGTATNNHHLNGKDNSAVWPCTKGSTLDRYKCIADDIYSIFDYHPTAKDVAKYENGCIETYKALSFSPGKMICEQVSDWAGEAP